MTHRGRVIYRSLSVNLGINRPLLDPVRRALRSFASHLERSIQRSPSSRSNARLEGLNAIFRAAGAIAKPAPSSPSSTRSQPSYLKFSIPFETSKSLLREALAHQVGHSRRRFLRVLHLIRCLPNKKAWPP